MSEKFIFLTGGAKRIGKTTCKHFHDEGFNVIFHYNSSKTEAEEIFEELNSKRKNSCHILQANFDDELEKIVDWYIKNKDWWQEEFSNIISNKRKNRMGLV